MKFNKKDPKIVSRFINDRHYINFEDFTIKHTLYMKNRDVTSGEISVVCIDPYVNFLGRKNDNKIFKLADIFFKKSTQKVFARGDIDAKQIQEIDTQTDDFLILEHTHTQHYNIKSIPKNSTLFQLCIAKQLAQISELNFRENWENYIHKKNNKIVTFDRNRKKA